MAGILKELGAQKGGGEPMYDINGNPGTGTGFDYDSKDAAAKAAAAKAAAAMNQEGGRRRRHSKGHRGNSWLTHVKATMKLNRGKSFKQVLKLAKKSYKKSQSQSGGRKRRSCKGQNGGSGGKVAGVGASASPYV
jgi:hypothetical protein